MDLSARAQPKSKSRSKSERQMAIFDALEPQ